MRGCIPADGLVRRAEPRPRRRAAAASGCRRTGRPAPATRPAVRRDSSTRGGGPGCGAARHPCSVAQLARARRRRTDRGGPRGVRVWCWRLLAPACTRGAPATGEAWFGVSPLRCGCNEVPGPLRGTRGGCTALCARAPSPRPARFNLAHARPLRRRRAAKTRRRLRHTPDRDGPPGPHSAQRRAGGWGRPGKCRARRTLPQRLRPGAVGCGSRQGLRAPGRGVPGRPRGLRPARAASSGPEGSHRSERAPWTRREGMRPRR